jgi:hypothetical protein
MHSTTRNEVKQLAQTLENLAHEVQVLLDSGANILGVANELARNSSTFVFTLGSMYAEDLGFVSSKKTKARSASTSSTVSSRNFHNVRDSLGRFTSKV